MQQLVQAGLDRTQKQASIKRGIDEGLQVVQTVRGIVDKAVHAAPEAAVAWVGVCLGLEVCMIIFPNRRKSGGVHQVETEARSRRIAKSGSSKSKQPYLMARDRSKHL